MVAQGYVLAARAFADELRRSVNPLSPSRAMELARNIEICMQCLKLLRSALTTLPDTSCDASDP